MRARVNIPIFPRIYWLEQTLLARCLINIYRSLEIDSTFKKGRTITMLISISSVLLVLYLQEEATNFNDLGKLLLGGVAAAIVCAVAFTIVRLRIRDKRPATSNFISIGPTDNKSD